MPTATPDALRLAESYAAFVAGRSVEERAGWSAWVGGQGPRTLVLLPGSTRVPHTYFQLVAALEPTTRVVAVSYPPEPSMDALADGLLGFLDGLGVTRFDLFGSSFGGFVALALARRAPDRVGRVVLANTAPPTPSLARRLRWARRLLRPLPDPVLRRVTGALWRRRLRTGPGLRGFWRDRLRDCLATQTAEGLRTHLDAMVDYARHPLVPSDLAQVAGPWLVVESGHDAAIPRSAQAALRALIPQAKVVRLPDAGHAAIFQDAALYTNAVAAFLAD